MAQMQGQFLGFVLGLLGMIGTLVATILPQWRRTAHIGSNIITSISYMAGLWMECVRRSTGIFQCEPYRSLLALPTYLQAARALMVTACVSSAFAVGISCMGMKSTRIADRSPAKNQIAVSGGFLFGISGLLCLVTMSWTTNDIVRDFHFFPLPSARYEIGPSVYLGFASAFLSLLGGVILCISSAGSQHHPSHRLPERLPHRLPPHQSPLDAPPPYQFPQTAFKSNHVPAYHSASSAGYRVGDFV